MPNSGAPTTGSPSSSAMLRLKVASSATMRFGSSGTHSGAWSTDLEFDGPAVASRRGRRDQAQSRETPTEAVARRLATKT